MRTFKQFVVETEEAENKCGNRYKDYLALQESVDAVAKHIRNTNPHVGTARDAEGSGRLADHDWGGGLEELHPTDPRLAHNYAHSKRDVKRYAKAYQKGSDFPPIVVAQDHYAPNKRLMVIDGAHRLEAAKSLNVPIKAYVGKVKQR